MMKMLAVICFCVVSGSALAQMGRYEEPRDSVPIGGEIQENKLNQMGLQDDLHSTLLQLRDSVDYIPEATRSQRRDELQSLLTEFKESERNPDLMKRGYSLVNRIRSEVRSRAGK